MNVIHRERGSSERALTTKKRRTASTYGYSAVKVVGARRWFGKMNEIHSLDRYIVVQGERLQICESCRMPKQIAEYMDMDFVTMQTVQRFVCWNCRFPGAIRETEQNA